MYKRSVAREAEDREFPELPKLFVGEGTDGNTLPSLLREYLRVSEAEERWEEVEKECSEDELCVWSKLTDSGMESFGAIL